MQRTPAESTTQPHDATTGPITVAGQALTLYTESPPLIDAMLADIRQAKSRVWLETYIFANDDAGRAVTEALAERARAGCDVRLLVDAWGSFSTPNALFEKLRAAGVQVHRFHAFLEAFYAVSFLQVLNQRDHRKLLVVDDQIAYFGGMNVVDQRDIQSKSDAKQRHLPASAGWRDVHVRMQGPRQPELAAAFERLWNRVQHLPAGDREPRWPVKKVAAAPDDTIYFFDSRPLVTNRRPHRILVPLLRQAQHDITLSVAYFVPLGRVLRELLKARKRGVRVRVILPGQSDVKIVQWASRHMYDYLLRRGVRIYERKDRMLHSKAMVIDGCWSMVGSCNLDARSLRLNLEFFAVARSRPLAQALLDICEQEIRQSERVTAAHVRRRSRWQRWLDRTAWTMRRWL
ncbi:MAG: phospholipase D-like domain-containing protein [Pirellulales bacterium]